MEERLDKLRERLRATGQEHVLRWWSDLGEPEREALLDQIERIDLEWVAQAGKGLRDGDIGYRFSGELGPVEHTPLPETPEQFEEAARAKAVGDQLLREGKVAALVVAGGQGTRLGFSQPKGCYPICPLSRNSLYHIHAESVLAWSLRCGCSIPLYVMTSEATDAPTRDFFAENDNFGLPSDDVYFLKQGMLPALSPEGKLVLAEKGRVLLSPNGHGGLYPALRDEGALDDMERRGIEEISYFQVDNVLIKQVDPVFIGRHRLAEAGMSSKAIMKRDPEEGLGAFGMDGDTLRIVEYSDLTEEQKRRKRDDGSLVFGLGSPAMHMIRVDFAREVLDRYDEMPYHIAEKSAAAVNEDGEVVEPEGKNVRKFEKFVFDALPLTKRSVIMEVAREEEFAPVKNAEGEDSPATARAAMTERWARWLAASGFRVERDDEGRAVAAIEISPLFALDAEQLREKLPEGERVGGKVFLACGPCPAPEPEEEP